MLLTSDIIGSLKKGAPIEDVIKHLEGCLSSAKALKDKFSSDEVTYHHDYVAGVADGLYLSLTALKYCVKEK